MENDKKSKKKPLFDSAMTLTVHLIVIIGIIWGMFGLVLGLKYAPNDDMSPNIKARDLLLYYRLDEAYASQDVIVLEKNGTVYVGRVVGAPGDNVNITESEELMINGSAVYETNIYKSTPRYEGFISYPVSLGSDEYFVLCDARDGGEDSRYYGVVRKSEIKGSVFMIIRRSGL